MDSPMRLTRRGQVVVFAALLMFGAAMMARPAPRGGAAPPAGTCSVVTVQRNDTLWSVAQRVAPGADPVATVEQIRRLNGLEDYTIYAGQELTVPVAR
jgi:hypothetical protein